MADIYQHFTQYVNADNGKQRVADIISKGIAEYKPKPYREWHKNGCPYDDSGELHEVVGKTIGDMCHTDIEVLSAYSGYNIATFTSGCGLHWRTVAEEICYDIDDYFADVKRRFIFENQKEVCEALDFTEPLDDDNYFDLLDEWDFCNADIFYNWFPEYKITEQCDEYQWETYLFVLL